MTGISPMTENFKGERNPIIALFIGPLFSAYVQYASLLPIRQAPFQTGGGRPLVAP